ncbi:hypothetical protein MPSEU_000533500 [Mayamaea pseudoterrestris]|nr:hypothetical protein MPSEU_000533500 [Mayamaea pseudoterrestris]
MTRFSFLAALLFAVFASTQAFTVPFGARQRVLSSRMANDDMPGVPSVDRGVSVDQDGKSNVWAIEPKMEVSSKSSDEKGATVLVAGGGLAAFAVVATLILTNLPDPNQY